MALSDVCICDDAPCLLSPCVTAVPPAPIARCTACGDPEHAVICGAPDWHAEENVCMPCGCQTTTACDCGRCDECLG